MRRNHGYRLAVPTPAGARLVVNVGSFDDGYTATAVVAGPHLSRVPGPVWPSIAMAKASAKRQVDRYRPAVVFVQRDVDNAIVATVRRGR